MDSSPQRRCPQCGTPVALKAESCLMCGASLKEQRKQSIKLPAGDLLLPLLLVLAVVVVWLWKPWEVREKASAEMAAITVTPSPSPVPTATNTAAPTATPLNSPTPSPPPTLPPNQTIHIVKPGETISTIAKEYGATVSAVLKANNKKADSLIKVGDQIIVPLPVANTPTPTPTILPSPTPVTYVVKTGDTLGEIASRFKTTVTALMVANNIADPTKIHVGWRLKIVAPDAVPSPTVAPPDLYEVKSGDTLSDIATKFNVSVADLRAANGIKGNLLHIGQKLKIPGGKPAAASPTAAPTAAEAAAKSAPAVESAPSITQPVTVTVGSLALVPAPTFTPAPPPAGVELLGPADGARFEGPNAFIMLHWASVGILDEDEWYVVRLRPVDSEENSPLLVWTKATSYRVPAELYEAGLAEPRRWRWRVLVMRQTGVADDGTWTGEEVRTPSDLRNFYWK